ncbi:MAG: iron-containing alcohol dehydrogenase [Deltaproteobacteria bacterium]|nr:iron-containing alcohol dehydrogenase [Deltaproteobacteria bacterium]
MIPAHSTFSFATATRVIFGNGSLARVKDEASRLGQRALLVTGSNPSRISDLAKIIGIPHHLFKVLGEPDVPLVQAGADTAISERCDMVIAVGGGSVIDAGKAISALMTNRSHIMTYLEVIGDGQPLSQHPAPFIAVPTTAGTGAEVTKNAVILSREHNVKVSLRSDAMLPDVAIVDPSLTISTPRDVTASTGLDALTQVIEPYVSVKSNPLTDAICEAGIKRAARSLKIVCDDGTNLSAREDMAITSLFGGLALANAGLGAVHGFAGPIGGLFDIPHGVVCGRLLPFVFKANVAAVSNIPKMHARFARVAEWLTGNPGCSVEDGIQWLDELCTNLNLRGLSSYGVTEGDLDKIVTAAKRASSMKGNPVVLSDNVLKRILEQAM